MLPEFMAIFLTMLLPSNLLTHAAIGENPYKLREMFVAELKIVKILEELHKDLGHARSPKELSWYLTSHDYVMEEFQEASLSNNDDDDNEKSFEVVAEHFLVTNILHVFLLMRRTVIYLPEIIRFLESDESSNDDNNNNTTLLSAIFAVQSSCSAWSVPGDLDAVTLSLARIQHVYQLSTMDLAKGFVGPDRPTSARLSPQDCMAVTRSRMEQRVPLMPTSDRPEYALAIEWTETAYEVLKTLFSLSVGRFGEASKYSIYVRGVLLHLRKEHDLHFIPPDPGQGSSRYPNEIFFISRIGQDITSSGPTGRQLRLREFEEFKGRFGGGHRLDSHSFSRRDFFTLCRGEELKLRAFPVEKPEIHVCKFETYNDPYLLIQPVKVEVLRSVPFEILIFHDAVSDSQVDYIKTEASNTLYRAEVFETFTSSLFSSERTQSISWLFEKDFPELLRLSKRLDHLSRLQVSFVNDPEEYTSFVESEDYQVGLYGPGGLYLAHYDYLQLKEVIYRDSLYLGDRVATLMIYLSDMEGGRTAFPNVGTFASPSKGSAVFWHNLLNDGTPNQLSIHGGCPVLYGTKWVSNKWIRYGSQFQKSKCLPNFNVTANGL